MINETPWFQGDTLLINYDLLIIWNEYNMMQKKFTHCVLSDVAIITGSYSRHILETLFDTLSEKSFESLMWYTFWYSCLSEIKNLTVKISGDIFPHLKFKDWNLMVLSSSGDELFTAVTWHKLTSILNNFSDQFTLIEFLVFYSFHDE